MAPEQAEQTLTEGREARHGMSARFDESFHNLTRLVTAALAPERLTELAARSESSPLRRLLDEYRVMKEHGHLEYLRNHLTRSEDLSDIPIYGFGELIAETGDEQEQQWLLRRAIQAWQIQREIPGRTPWQLEDLFLRLFRDSWTVLPRSEAAEVVDELTQRILAKRGEGTFGKVQDLEFKSLHALKLFLIYDLMLELTPERAEEVRKKKRELARAVKRYPRGQRRKASWSGNVRHEGEPRRRFGSPGSAKHREF
ncbi:MAG: hypothetical protein ACJ746_18880 [Bryobacteraceae bacterium]